KLTLIEQLKPMLAEFRQRSTKLRELMAVGAADKAVATFLGDHEQQARQMRDLLLRDIEALDATKPHTANLARAVLVTLSVINDALGRMVLETTDARMAEISREIAGLGS